jgi:hypothetical protein
VVKKFVVDADSGTRKVNGNVDAELTNSQLALKASQ